MQLIEKVEVPTGTKVSSRVAQPGGRLGYSFRVVLRPQEDGGFSAFVPDLPGAISQGESQPEVVANMRDALAGLLEAYGTDALPFLEEPEYVWLAGDIETRIAIDV